MKKLCRSLIVSVSMLLASTAGAATLDFSSLGSGSLGTTVAVLPEATITSFGSDIFVGASGIDDEICAIALSEFSCEADLQIDFSSTVSALSFVTSGHGSGDSVTASIFDESDSLISSLVITANTLVDFTAFSGISRLFLDDNSTNGGFGYGEFSFDESDPQLSPVPVPAAVWLFGSAALGLIGFARRRKQA